MFSLFKRPATPARRAHASTSSAARFFEVMGMTGSGGQIVTERTALGVPAVFAAVNFIAGTIAGLPLHVYRRGRGAGGATRESGRIATILHDAVLPDTTSFEWRKYTFEQVLTGGRGLTRILRNGRGEVIGLEPLQPSRVTVQRVDGLRRYRVQSSSTVTLPAEDVIDIPFMLDEDRLTCIGPIAANRVAIGQALAVQEYTARFFDNGGVPPFAVTGPFRSGDAMGRAAGDLAEAVRSSAREGRQALILPDGLEIKSIGADPDKMQMLELQRFCVENVARIYSLPPVFLQDLTRGTYSNTEQQDLHFVKHTLKRWIEQLEQELTLKIFGAGSELYAEFNLDGLLRGDFATRMDGLARAIQNGLLTPNEGRAMENRPPLPGGDDLMVQGATVPIIQQIQPQQPAQEGDRNDL